MADWIWMPFEVVKG